MSSISNSEDQIVFGESLRYVEYLWEGHVTFVFPGYCPRIQGDLTMIMMMLMMIFYATSIPMLPYYR